MSDEQSSGPASFVQWLVLLAVFMLVFAGIRILFRFLSLVIWVVFMGAIAFVITLGIGKVLFK